MKKFLLFFCALFCTIFAANATNPLDNTKYYITDETPGLQFDKDGAVQTLEIGMVNETAISAVQFDLYLPSCLEVVYDEDEEGYVTDLARTTFKKHAMEVKKQTSGAYRVLIYSSSNKEFSGNEGTIATLDLKYTDESKPAKLDIVAKNVVLAAANGDNAEIEEVVFQGAVTSVKDVKQATEGSVKSVYNVNGQKSATTKKGINIVKYANGTSKKVLVK